VAAALRPCEEGALSGGGSDYRARPLKSLQVVPTLEDLINDPTQIAGVAPAVAGELLTRCDLELSRLNRVRDGLLIRLALGAEHREVDHRPDVFDDIEEAARLIGRTPSFIYRNHRTLPFVIQEGRGRRLRFSRAAIARFFEQHRGEAA